MTLKLFHVASISIAYTLLLFLIAWIASRSRDRGKSLVNNPLVYSLSIAIYCTSWTFFGSIGKAATTGIDFLMIYLGPTLTAFSWFYILQKMIRVSKESNVSSIADFISLRYGKSQLLGTLVTLIATLGIMPYIALQIKAVSTSFSIVSGITDRLIPLPGRDALLNIPTGLILTLIFALFGMMFGARRLSSTERHEGLMAAIAFESVVKLVSMLVVGAFVTWGLFNGFGDIFTKFNDRFPELFRKLLTIESRPGNDIIPSSTMLIMSMGAIMLLPRQFHVMVVENADPRHVSKAMWLFPAYMFLINLFIVPIALGGILLTGSSNGADYFIVTLPLLTGHEYIAMIAFLGGLSAAAGMVMVESVAISTMLLNHLFMPVIVRITPKQWFPLLLINLKRFGIILVVFMGYIYYRLVGDSFMLVNMGLISFLAAMQFLPALLGGLYWKRGNKSGAVSGMIAGFIIWGYTLLVPSFLVETPIHPLIAEGPFGISILRPTELFALSGMDMWSHSLFWSMLFNIGAYLTLSLLLPQSEREKEQVRKFIGAEEVEPFGRTTETKRLSKPVSIAQLTSMMGKFIGEAEAKASMESYLKGREISPNAKVSEFELPGLKRFAERTLAGSVGAAAAGAIVDSFLSDMGSRMESVYDIFSTVRTSLDQSREALYVRLKASEIMNRSMDLQVICDELLKLLINEFGLDTGFIQLRPNRKSDPRVVSYQGPARRPVNKDHWYMESEPYFRMAMTDKVPRFVNDLKIADGIVDISCTRDEGFVSFAHIPIFREDDECAGVLSVYSKTIVGLFTQEFINLLLSLTGQLAQAVRLVNEMEARDSARKKMQEAQLEKAKMTRDMEIAQQIQLSLLPANPPQIFGIELAGRCIPATHVGGDYYDFLKRDEHTVDIIIADVSGHSVGASLIMTEVRTLLRGHSSRISSPSSILGILNKQLYDDLTRAELFITMFYARYDATTGKLSYANAGHNRPVLHSPGGQPCRELDAEGLILGIKPEVTFSEESVTLHTGDIIFFHTDGIPEATAPDGEMYGNSRICLHLSNVFAESAESIADSFYREAREFSGSNGLQDDISMVVLKILT